MRSRLIQTLVLLVAMITPSFENDRVSAEGVEDATQTLSFSATEISHQIVAGYSHVCVLDSGEVVCWGNNFYGQLGIGNTDFKGARDGDMAALQPVDLGSGVVVDSIATGEDHVCALLSTGEVKCWGYNEDGQLGIGTTDHRGDEPNEMGDNLRAVNFGNGVTAVAITAGSYHTCALLSTGDLKCWGYNGEGQLGQGNDNSVGGSDTDEIADLPAIDLGTDLEITSIYSGSSSSSTCAVFSDGSVKCWGYNEYGELGHGLGSAENVIGDEPEDLGTALPFTNWGEDASVMHLSLGNGHICAVLDSGRTKCLGSGWTNGVGPDDRGYDLEDLGDNLPFVDLGTDVTVTQTSAGAGHTCALLSSGEVKCWGNNDYGELGLGLDENEIRGGAVEQMGDALPSVDFGTSVEAVSIAVGADFSCALFANGAVKCWGDNERGQLGLDDVSDRGGRVHGAMGDDLPLLQLEGTSAVAAGAQHTCALLSSGGVKCWGDNLHGQLGDGSETDSNTPVEVTGISSAVSLAAGSGFTCAVLGDATGKCWGRNTGGLLGANDGSTASSSLPVSVDLNGIEQIVAGNSRACALLTDKSVKCWGGSTSIYGAEPVGINGLAGSPAVESISAGTSHFCALTTDDTVRCWGYGLFGQLGDGTQNTSWTTAVEVSGLAGVLQVSAGSNHSCALLSGGTVKCWGLGSYGEMGDGSYTYANSVPVTVLNVDNAIEISSGNKFTCAVLTTTEVKCWGRALAGELGIGETGRVLTPQSTVSLGDSFQTASLSTGSQRAMTCAISTSNAVKCWGRNGNGELGIGSDTYYGGWTEQMGDSLPVSFQTTAYSLNYDSGGATGGAEPPEFTVIPGYQFAIADNSGSLVKSGYTFEGWNTAADGSGTSYSAGDLVSLSGDVTLFARWRAVPVVDPEVFVALTPARIMDTRSGDKVGELDGSGSVRELQVTGAGGVPTAGVSAVALNVTAVSTETNDFGGFVTVFPCGTRPDASNLNFTSGMTIPNSVIAPVSDDGKVCFYVYGKTHLLADVSGYFSSGFESLTPSRIMDTRSGDKVGELDGSGAVRELQVTGAGGVPSSGVSAVALNVTAVSTETNDFGGFVTVFPCGTRPDASNLNFTSGMTIPNSVIAPVSSDGKVCFYVYGKTHLLADVSGYFSSGFESLTPDRIMDTRSGDKVGELDGSGAVRELQVTGAGGVPSTGVSAVALNVTAVSTETNDFGGFVTVFPCGTRPDASNLNFTSGMTIPNSVIAPVSSDGKVCFYVYGKAHLLADVSGYFG